MATAVQIELMVDEKGAVSGVRSFDTAVKGTTGSVRQLSQELGAVGTRAAAAGQKGKAGLDQVGEGAISSREKVRLLSEEIGIRIPRAMQSVISQSKAVQSALSVMGTAMIGLGAIQIGAMAFTQLYDGAKKFYEKFLDVDGAIKKFNEEAATAASKRFYENAGIEDLNRDLAEANRQLDQLNQKKATLPSAGEYFRDNPSGFAAVETARALGFKREQPYFSTSDAGKLNAAQGKSDEDEMRAAEKKHQEILQAIEDTKLLSAAKVQGIQKERIERDAADAAADENQKYKVAVQSKLAQISARAGKQPGEEGYVPTPGKDAYQAETDAAKRRAAAQFQASQFDTEREQAQELRHIHEEALESGLRGSALYHAQESAVIEDLKQKHIASQHAIADIHQKYHNEEMRRLEDEGRETEKIERQGAIAGMSGIVKTRAEGASRVADINADDNLDPANRIRRVAAINRETDAEIAQEKRAMAEEINQISDQSATHQISGFARINAEASRQIDELRKKIRTVYGEKPLIGPASTDQAAGANLLQQGTAAINQGAQDQRAELASRNADETAQIEAEARTRSLSAEKQRTAAIEAEYNARLEKYQEELKAQEISQDDFNRRVAAAAQERDADMGEAARQAREKMAGEFDSLFKSLDHPLKALASLGDRVAGEAAASLVQRIQQHGQGGGAAQPAPGGGILGDMLGGFGFGGRHGTVGAGVPATSTGSRGGAHTVAEAVFTVQQATIHVGSAMSMGGVSGAGSGSIPGALAWSPAAGGTSLLASQGITGCVSGENYAPSSSGGGAASSFTAGSSGMVAARGYAIGAGLNDVGSGIGIGTQALSAGGGKVSTGSGESSERSASSIEAAAAAHGYPVPRGGYLNANGDYTNANMYYGPNGVGGGHSAGAGSSYLSKLPWGKKETSDTGINDPYAETQSPEMAGKLNADGTYTSSGSTNSGMLGGGGVGANAMGAVGGALGMYSAYEGKGGVGGAMSGAMSGMQLGMAVGGPLGAGIGAAAGAIVGAIGFGGREQARVYDLKTVRPRLKNDQDSYEQGGMDYLTAYSDMQSLQAEAFKTLSAMGPAAHAYRSEYVDPEIKQAEGKLTAQQRAGRSMYTAQPAQYDVGTDSVPRTGMAVIHQNERIVPSDQNERITRALESGTSMDAIHATYQQAMQTNNARQSSGAGDRTMNMNVHAIDAQGVSQFLDKYKHHIRAAVNDSYAENSGGGL